MTQAIASADASRNGLLQVAAGGILTGLVTPLLPQTLSGGVSYGLLYLDGTVRLQGDTAITATKAAISTPMKPPAVPGTGLGGRHAGGVRGSAHAAGG